jgi:predicted nucleic acid-binding Zn ribbon protein
MAFRSRPRRSNRERALAQLRGYWAPQDVSKFEQDMGGAVEKTLKSLGLENRFNEEQVFEAWSELVDGFVAENARPVSMHRKILYIQVLHSTVFYELERMRGQILSKMQDRFGADNIRDVKFRLG